MTIYLKEQYLNKIHHNTISVQYGNGLAKECEFSGIVLMKIIQCYKIQNIKQFLFKNYNFIQFNNTKDFSLSLSLIDGVNFIKKYGLNQIIKYSEDLAWEGANLVAQIWQTELLVNDKSMHSAMVNVKIPHQDQNYCRECQKKCFEKYNVFLVVQFDLYYFINLQKIKLHQLYLSMMIQIGQDYLPVYITQYQIMNMQLDVI